MYIIMTKKILSCALAAMMLCSTGVFAENTNTEQKVTAELAEQANNQDVIEAYKIGVIDSVDQNWDQEINREEFCDEVYNMLNGVKEFAQVHAAYVPFQDVASYTIHGLYFAGIVSGKGNETFAPKDLLTWEEMAVILKNGAEYAEIALPAVKVDAEAAKKEGISEWAIPAVYSVKVLGLLDAAGDHFQAQEHVTKGQAISAIMSLYRLTQK